MSRKTPPAEGALYVRLPAQAADKLDRASETLGIHKKDLIAGLVTKYVDPDSQRGLAALGMLGTLGKPGREGGPMMGTYSFQAYDPPADVEIMNAEQTGRLLQIEEAVVIELAEKGQLPGRKLGTTWRFSRTALIAWLAAPEQR